MVTLYNKVSLVNTLTNFKEYELSVSNTFVYVFVKPCYISY